MRKWDPTLGGGGPMGAGGWDIYEDTYIGVTLNKNPYMKVPLYIEVALCRGTPI